MTRISQDWCLLIKTDFYRGAHRFILYGKAARIGFSRYYLNEEEKDNGKDFIRT